MTFYVAYAKAALGVDRPRDGDRGRAPLLDYRGSTP
jgi:hypothetical protein